LLIFLEKFVIPILVALVGIILINPLKFDRAQQISLFLAVVCLAYFFGHTIHRIQQAKAFAPAQPAATAPLELLKPSGDAKTSGSDSPAVTGGVNNFTYDQAPDSKKLKAEPRK